MPRHIPETTRLFWLRLSSFMGPTSTEQLPHWPPNTQAGWDEAIKNIVDALNLRDNLPQRSPLLAGLPDPANPIRGSHPISLGNGAYSGAHVEMLHRRLDHAVMILGGLQQGMYTDDPLYIEGVADIKAVIEDIAMCLLGVGVTFGQKSTPGTPTSRLNLISNTEG